MIAALKSASATVRAQAVHVVACFFIDAEHCLDLAAKGALEPLLDMVQDNHASVRNGACLALSKLLVNAEIADRLLKMGLLELLINLCQSQTKNNQISEDVLKQLLKHNLTAKYAYTGYLGATDRIPHHFFDCGRLHWNDPLPDYYLESSNSDCLIIGVCLKQEKMVSSLARDTGVNSMENSTVLDNNAPTAEDVSSETNSSSKMSTVSMPRQSAAETGSTAYLPSEDFTLAKYIKESREQLLPMASMTEQVTALGKFVAECMGGAVAPDHLNQLNYDQVTSELKLTTRSNVIPLGLLTAGLHSQRALLFKVLADHAGLSVTLERGEYSRTWNEVRLDIGSNSETMLVDLMHNPGQLFRKTSPEAISYVHL